MFVHRVHTEPETSALQSIAVDSIWSVLKIESLLIVPLSREESQREEHSHLDDFLFLPFFLAGQPSALLPSPSEVDLWSNNLGYFSGRFNSDGFSSSGSLLATTHAS